MTEYQCLRFFSRNGPTEYTAFLNIARKKYHTSGPAASARFIDLLDKGYLHGAAKPNHVLSISKPGRLRLQDLSDERFRYWYPIAISNLLSAAALIVSVIALLHG